MRNHLPKSIPDRVLKGMILQTMLRAQEEDRQLTSLEIHNYVSNNSFEFISPELDKYGNPTFSGNYTYDNLPGLRASISYLKKAGYVSLYDRNWNGDIIREQQVKPYVWYLTLDGEIHARDTFHKFRIRLDAIEREINQKVAHRLSNDEQVVYLAEQKRIELCKTCRDSKPPRERLRARTSTANPHQGRIGINRKNGSVREYTVNEDTGEIKELEDLKNSLVMNKDGSVNNASTIMSLQNENIAMRKLLAETGQRYIKSEAALTKEKGRKTLRTEKEFIRTMDRMGLATYYGKNSMYLDADFFTAWGNALVVVEYKRTLWDGLIERVYDIQGIRSEIMTRTGFVNRVLEPDEIQMVGIYIFEIKGSSIVFNSEHFTAPKTVRV